MIAEFIEGEFLLTEIHSIQEIHFHQYIAWKMTPLLQFNFNCLLIESLCKN